MTIPSAENARAIAESLVSEHLAACCNVLPASQSIYRWQGKIEYSTETVVIIKTIEENVALIIDFVTQNHPYECPCIVSFKIDQGHPGYLKWLNDEVILKDS